jgi:hypothetical protein
MSFLSALGGDVKKVFGWLASPKGQAVVQLGEGIVEDAFPAATGVINIFNTWATEAFKVQAIAEAAGSDVGAQKASVLLNTITPEVLAFAKTHGLPTPTADKLAQVNNAIILAINILSGTETVPTPPAA